MLIGDLDYNSNGFRAVTKQGMKALPPADQEPQTGRRTRRDTLQTAPQNREHACQAQGLGACRHALRPMRPHLLFGRLHRCGRPVLPVVSKA